MIAVRFLVLTSLVVLAGCGSGNHRLDRRTQDILANADRVEVFRIDGMLECGKEVLATSDREIGEFPVLAQGKDQGKEFANRLGDILSDKQIHDNHPKCFCPGIAFRVWRGDDCIDALICFKCDNFYCGPPTKDARKMGNFGGTPLRSRLLQLTKEAFPEDKEIQALEDK